MAGSIKPGGVTFPIKGRSIPRFAWLEVKPADQTVCSKMASGKRLNERNQFSVRRLWWRILSHLSTVLPQYSSGDKHLNFSPIYKLNG